MEEPSMNSKARSFTSSEIAEMTSNFTTVIGKGGHGKVYLGTMNDGSKAAVKVLLSSSEQYHGKEALIYDYMVKGNLKQKLLGKRETILSWNERLQIALDVAHGLEYLHGCKPPIIHRDMKPENILFNKHMEAKIAYFGLSRAFPTESTSHISTDVKGTFEYLDPEYYNTGHLSKKNDLYSFGIILLELVSGKPAVIKIDNEDAINIIKWIHPLIKRRDIRSIVDRRLDGELDIKAAERAIKIAMSCVMKPITERPDISHVVAKLKCSDIEMRFAMVNWTGWVDCLHRIYKNLTKGQKGTTSSKMRADSTEVDNPQPQPLPAPSSSPLQIGNDTSEDKENFNMTEPAQSSEAKNPSFSSGDDDEIVESDVELDNTDIVEPDNDPPQKVFVEMVLLQPRDFPKMNDSGAPGLSDPTKNTSEQKAGPNQGSFAEKLNEAHHDKSNSYLSHSCPLPREVDGRYLPQIKPIDAKNNDFSSEMSCSSLSSAKTGCTAARSRNLEGKVASVKPAANEPLKGSDPKVSKVAPEKVRSASPFRSVNPAVNEPLKGSDPKVSKFAPEKVRSTSPFRRFSFGIGKSSKSSSSRDTSAVPQLSSACTSAKCDSDIPVASCHASTYGDRTNAASKGRSSPLRRLLDPLLKPKAVSCSNVAESVEKRSISTERARKSLHGLALSSTTSLLSGKVKSETTSTRCSTVNVNDLSNDNKHGSSVIQALLRVQFKNGLPLFTFAFKDESDILAATMKMSGASSKDSHGCIFTFFSIQEVRKKNGRWMNQGGKGKGQDYIVNEVAQMKVSGSDILHLPRQNCIDQFRVREFVLLGVDIGQANQPTSDFQQKDELAAIVMKIPKRTTKGSSRDGYQTVMHNDSHRAGLKHCLPDVKFDSNFVEDIQNSLFFGHQDIDTTVILPSGVHSLPSKGGPSSLIQRWTTGGSCDCGGWDLGCKLKVLSNGNQLSQRHGLRKSSSHADQFELFFEGGPQENKPFFSMARFKDRIYSVEFNSSLSHLQAFSICIAVCDDR